MKFEMSHREYMIPGVKEALTELTELCAGSETESWTGKESDVAVTGTGEDGLPGTDEGDPMAAAEAGKTATKPKTTRKPKEPAVSEADALTRARAFRAKNGQKASTDAIKKYGASWADVKPENYGKLIADMDAYDAANGGDEEAGEDDPLAGVGA